jgi:NADPH2:quinone reductase
MPLDPGHAEGKFFWLEEREVEMKAAWYEANGSARDVLTYGEFPTPEPGPGEVRVRLAASGVNPSDVKSRARRPLISPKIVPHSDGAGVIDAVGEGVPQSRIGERVWIWNGQWKRPFGTAAEFIALHANQAVPLPENTSFEEGACLGIPALTALRAMTIDGSVAGKTVLVSGGAGAVGAYAIQFARFMGAARIITTVSSREKADLAIGLGADHAINYRGEDVAARVQEITGGRGVDRVVEVDAAANGALLPAVLAQDGLAVIYGSGKPEVSFEFFPLINRGIALRFFIVYELVPQVRVETVEALNAYLKAGLLRHQIAEHYSLQDVIAAHEAVESGKVVGNVVINLPEA